ncbi:metallophosphatase [Shewanella hanedai]|uniref:Alkaline phosphatase family protein n=1 Tax=Shewanella hanedai TaxID=25 RepID=A0A553JRD5_SHEHA|nr:alkaline phosphatase D family protein [Shewanella hanedai]TRY15018.1 alkaline phosphatase family protein [Shewanella hanedai]GGI75521.1 metallophosphatase [Shewanella hanedai]
MALKLILGPILGLESDSLYTVLFVANKSIINPKVNYLNTSVDAINIGEIESGIVWRAELTLSPDTAQHITYSIHSSDMPVNDARNACQWRFYVPAKDEQPKLAYASCNGFSDYKLMTSTDNPYHLWEEMAAQHEDEPFSLLLMGGDQVYADSIWTTVPTLKAWNDGGRKQKVKYVPSKRMQDQISRFYNDLYIDRWNKPAMAQMLASVPSLMMWDDHDIIDGWGSFPSQIQTCPVYNTIFESAKKFFSLLQIRGHSNQTLLCQQDEPTHFSSHVKFRHFNILALDNRSERSINEVMSSSHWSDVISTLESNCLDGDLLVLSAVPVVYRDFSFAESALDATPWEEELTDDLKDHWRAKEHEGERLKLIMRLLDNVNTRQGKTVMLSGDVHLGGLGIIIDERGDTRSSIHQVISSGIVHPAPTYMQWLGILAVTNDNLEYLDETRLVTSNMIKPHGSNKYIRNRNFVTLLEGSDSKLWINWICEGKDKPSYPLQ